jgi:hypothetical protein
MSRDDAAHFLRTMFEADDWVAVFLKAYDTGHACQRVAPVAVFTEPRWQTWLRVMNVHRFNVYVSVNAVTPWRRARTKEAVHAVRHVFLDADHGGPDILRRLERWHDLPRPSSVLRTSPGRVQVLWRVHGFSPECVERLQKQLARELGTDLAATACTQTMRIPGFLNWKYAPPVVVTGEYGDARTVFEPSDFPIPVDPHSATGDEPAPLQTGRTNGGRSPLTPPDVIERARRYMAAVPAAVSGQRGDVRTFQVCCRLARGFGLAPGDALNLLAEWNARCNPPWTEHELIAKLDHAQRYGREPIGGLLSGGV